MIKNLIAAVVFFLPLFATAATSGEYCSQRGTVTEYMCGATPTGPGWYLANDGCYYRDTNRPCYQPPQPPPPPAPMPPPPQNGRYVHCASYGYRYSECYLPYGNIQRVTLVRQYSREACVA